MSRKSPAAAMATEDKTKAADVGVEKTRSAPSIKVDNC